VIKYEVIKRMDTSRMDYPHYTFYVDRVRITLQPQRPTYYQVYLSPRVDDGAFTLTDLARSLPETDYSDETLVDKIFHAQEADIRDLIVSHLLTWYKCSSDDKRRILLNLKPGINTTEELMKKSVDLLAERNKRPSCFSMELHLMSLEDLLNLFSGGSDDDDDDDAAKAKLLALCI